MSAAPSTPDRVRLTLPMPIRLTPPMQRALQALDRRVLRQYEDLYRRDRVQWHTLNSLIRERADRPALVQRVELRTGTIFKAPYHQFYRLTEAGVKLLREMGK